MSTSLASSLGLLSTNEPDSDYDIEDEGTSAETTEESLPQTVPTEEQVKYRSEHLNPNIYNASRQLERLQEEETNEERKIHLRTEWKTIDNLKHTIFSANSDEIKLLVEEIEKNMAKFQKKKRR